MARLRQTAERLAAFREAFGVPEVAAAWLHRLFSDAEIDVVLAVTEGPRSVGVLVQELPGGGDVAKVAKLVTRAWRRGIVDLDPEPAPGVRAGAATQVSPADFHTRYEVAVLFEDGAGLPEDVLHSLALWELDSYQERKRPQLDALRAGLPLDASIENETYLLLHEAEDVIDRVAHVYLWPCNCRVMMGTCDLPRDTCLRFSNSRGLGKEISKEKAKSVLARANKAGLMQTGELAVREGSLEGAICNCCSDCCYPHQVAEREGAQKLWPLSRYTARYSAEACTRCGRCTERCPFGAFRALAEEGEKKPRIEFVATLCRGCGVCVTGCKHGAVEMVALEGRSGYLPEETGS